MYGYGVAQEKIDCVCVYVWVWCGTGDDRLCIDITMTFDRLCMYTYRMSPACFHKYIYCLLELNILCDCVTQVFIIHTICCVYIHIICHDRLCMHTHHMCDRLCIYTHHMRPELAHPPLRANTLVKYSLLLVNNIFICDQSWRTRRCVPTHVKYSLLLINNIFIWYQSWPSQP
jgi:hypothetical protein